MDLRKLANSYVGFDGLVTFHIRPYQSLRVNAQLDALEAIKPQFVWRHKKTGVEVTKEPDDWTVAAEAAAAFGTAVDSVWERVRQWDVIHDTFALCEPDTVALDFAEDKPLTAEVRALRMYFENRNGSVAKNWALFNDLLSATILNEWWAAYSATRDTAMALPENTPDPNA